MTALAPKPTTTPDLFEITPGTDGLEFRAFTPRDLKSVVHGKSLELRCSAMVKKSNAIRALHSTHQ